MVEESLWDILKNYMEAKRQAIETLSPWELDKPVKGKEEVATSP